jgi:hypothetical protein
MPGRDRRWRPTTSAIALATHRLGRSPCPRETLRPGLSKRVKRMGPEAVRISPEHPTRIAPEMTSRRDLTKAGRVITDTPRIYRSHEVPLCECSSRTRLQVSFELYCRRLITEVYRHENVPRPVRDGLHILPRVMTSQPLFKLACQPYVMPGGSTFAPKHIHNSFSSA